MSGSLNIVGLALRQALDDINIGGIWILGAVIDVFCQ